mgnify:CR=1 FL=1
MELVETKDSRKLRKSPKFGFKGNTVKKGPAYMLLHRPNYYTVSTVDACHTCKGACIFSAFYDSGKNRRKYDGMFDPKYHRVLVRYLQANNLVPREGEIYKSSEEYFAEAEERERKSILKDELGHEYHDPESLELLSRKQKAKAKRYKLREQEAISKEEVWVDVEYGKEEFRDMLNLCKDYRRDRSKLEKIWFSKWCQTSLRHPINYKRSKKRDVFIKGNRVDGYLKFTNHCYRDDYETNQARKWKKEAIELQMKDDIVLAADDDHTADLLLKALLGV